ncbi:DUF1433 domain-containing protein [Vagococcus entomophilus]|nr:DUF1433 domain-containing protein [Vagococcus entomophilus]
MVRIEQQKNSEQKIANFWETQKPRVEKFIKYNFKDVKTITFTKIENDPLGSNLFGYINNDKEMDFDVSVSLGTGETEFNTGISYSEKMGELEKYPKVIPLSEIENHKKKTNESS